MSNGRGRIAGRSEAGGFSLIELLVSLATLLPLMAAALMLFKTAVTQYSSEQSNTSMNQEARIALEMMALEIAQAGAHKDSSTSTTAAITASTVLQSLHVTSASSINVNDWVDVDTGNNGESIRITAAGTGFITGVVRKSHTSGVPVRLYAYPYATGILPATGQLPNSAANASALRFYGDMNNDGTLYYIQYQYDSVSAQITRSMTALSQVNKSAGQPFIRNVKSAHFVLYADKLGFITSVRVAITVQNAWTASPTPRDNQIASRIIAPSVAAASARKSELQQFGGIDRLPATPARVTVWAGP